MRRFWGKIQKGFIALLSVIVIGSIALAIMVSSGLLAATETSNTFIEENYLRAAAMADGCVEEGLIQLKNSETYAGDETLTIAGTSCSIGSIGGFGNLNRTFNTSSTVNAVTVRVSVTVDRINPTMIVSKWERVASF